VTDPLDALARWAAPLLANLAPQRRRRVMADVATALRQGQAARIAQQRNTDGSAYEPRKAATGSAAPGKPGIRQRKGALRRAMFEKLRTAKHLRRTATAGSATLAIQGAAGRIARIHQYGLRDRVDWRRAGSPIVRYARRELLGFTEADIQAIETRLLAAIAADP
jgi:phage virion morphogenesis protein